MKKFKFSFTATPTERNQKITGTGEVEAVGEMAAKNIALAGLSNDLNCPINEIDVKLKEKSDGND